MGRPKRSITHERGAQLWVLWGRPPQAGGLPLMSVELFSAIKAGDVSKVRQMLDEHPALLQARDESGLGAYTVARYSRQSEIAQLLLDKGAALDIFAACMAGVQTRVVELLAVDRGLVNAYSHDGWTPLHLAAFFGQPGIAEVLLANGADVHARSTNEMKNTPLHAAVAGRNVDAVGTLLVHGANVNAQQHGGWTPLHGAAQSGDSELVSLLIAMGADVKARADNQQNALDLALLKGHQAVVTQLEEHGVER